MTTKDKYDVYSNDDLCCSTDSASVAALHFVTLKKLNPHYCIRIHKNDKLVISNALSLEEPDNESNKS